MTLAGDHYRNVGLGMAAGYRAMRLGWAPYIPHLDAMTTMALGFAGELPVSYEEWMELDFVFVRAAHALLRIPGHSPGADREVLLARSLGKTVYSEEDLPEVTVTPLRSVPLTQCPTCGFSSWHDSDCPDGPGPV
jgi:hypothetical protein